MAEIRCQTIGDFIRYGMSLTAWCTTPSCYHSQKLDLPGLAELLGEDFDIYTPALTRRLRCQKCGAKGAKVMVSGTR